MAGSKEAEGFWQGAQSWALFHTQATPGLRDHWKDMAASNPLTCDVPTCKRVGWAFYHTMAHTSPFSSQYGHLQMNPEMLLKSRKA